ncbi:unnamed protein product [Fraxinus pennsylvanica]|uniref:DUF4283 domain-containing protein n=1 Tax=Fraxinus pennsylvanica TaxID=56036 RepID=A0AAD1ZS22_9LAMI|nr:unnamed protein product [Fraxinus pennsylvanica]
MKFLVKRPNIDQIRLAVVKTWGLQETPIISFMDSSHVLIQLRNEEDFLHTWARERRSIAGSVFRLFKWTVDFDIYRESSTAPQWIFLPGLPLHLYRVDCLKILASRFGRYLGTDHETLNRTRATGARICVETDLRAEPVEGFPMRFPTRTYSQEVKYEKLDFYCNRCGRQGHPEFACRVDQPKQVRRRKRTREEKGKAKMEWKRKEMGTLEEKQIEAGKENMRSDDIVIKTDVRKEETDYTVDNSRNVEVLPEGDHGETGNYSGSQDREHAVEMNDKELGELFIEHEQAQVTIKNVEEHDGGAGMELTVSASGELAARERLEPDNMGKPVNNQKDSVITPVVEAINDEDVEEERAINVGSDCEISEVRGDACDQREKDYMSDTEINKIATGQGGKRLTLSFSGARPLHSDQRMAMFAKKINLSGWLSNKGEGGKIWVFWRDDIRVEWIGASSQTLHGMVLKDNQKIVVSFIYAKCTALERRELWQELESLRIGGLP